LTRRFVVDGKEGEGERYSEGVSGGRTAAGDEREGKPLAELPATNLGGFTKGSMV